MTISEETLAGGYEPYGLGRCEIKQYMGIVWSAQRTYVINDLGLDRVSSRKNRDTSPATTIVLEFREGWNSKGLRVKLWPSHV